MTIHDHAHNLARAIKEAPEYKEYMRLKDLVAENEDLNNMLMDFRQQQMAFQTQQMLGMAEEGEAQQQFMEQIQELYQILMQDPLAVQYLQAEMVFSQIVGDVYKILGEVIQIA